MGFMAIDLVYSDMAANAYYNLKKAYPKNAIEVLNEEVTKDHSRYNTPGPVNVALCIVDGELELAHLEGFKPLVEKALKWFDIAIPWLKENNDPLLPDHERLEKGLREFL